MKSSDRVSIVAQWVARISNSRFSVRAYCRRFQVPFSQRQYFIYQRQWQQQGVGVLRDGRGSGNPRKRSAEAEGFLAADLRTHAEVSLAELQRLVQVRFKAVVTTAALSRALQRLGVSRTARRTAAVDRA